MNDEAHSDLDSMVNKHNMSYWASPKVAFAQSKQCGGGEFGIVALFFLWK